MAVAATYPSVRTDGPVQTSGATRSIDAVSGGWAAVCAVVSGESSQTLVNWLHKAYIQSGFAHANRTSWKFGFALAVANENVFTHEKSWGKAHQILYVLMLQMYGHQRYRLREKLPPKNCKA